MGFSYEDIKFSYLKDVAKTLKLKGRSKMSREQLLKILMDDNTGCVFEISCFDLIEMLQKWRIKKSTVNEEIRNLSYNLVKDHLFSKR